MGLVGICDGRILGICIGSWFDYVQAVRLISSISLPTDCAVFRGRFLWGLDNLSSQIAPR
jgi:hypothetical protein